MKNYFQKILSLFARHNYSEQTNQMFYRWLVDNEYEKEKDEALQELYLEARKKGKVFDLEKSLERWKLDNNLTHVQPQQKSDKTVYAIVAIGSCYIINSIYIFRISAL